MCEELDNPNIEEVCEDIDGEQIYYCTEQYDAQEDGGGASVCPCCGEYGWYDGTDFQYDYYKCNNDKCNIVYGVYVGYVYR